MQILLPLIVVTATLFKTAISQILRKPETSTIQTTTPSPGLCDQGVGFNSYSGNCTQYVQCWMQEGTVMSLMRSCPFGQFWDADAITCRPSFLVLCTAVKNNSEKYQLLVPGHFMKLNQLMQRLTVPDVRDVTMTSFLCTQFGAISDPCKQSTVGFTYSMKEYGCRAYWNCVNGSSVGHCCPMGSAYVDGMGCLEIATCNEECPPSGGIAVRPICDKKPHWDKRYYIEIVFGREVARHCPTGTIFSEEKCVCVFGLSGLLPTTADVLCQPSAFFPFDQNLQDQSLNRINVGLTNMTLTDLGTAYLNGNSEMNLWRFAGADWGNKLVIKFKFRFDYSNKFIDYGGLPVDLGIDFDVNMNYLISDFNMTDMDWRLWNQLGKIRTIDEWRQLLREFGQSRTFYIFLGTLGFKAGTSNSLQVVRILGTPEAYGAFQAMLNRMRSDMLNGFNLNEKSSAGLKGILQQLRSMTGLIKWDNIIAQLRGESQTTASSGSPGSGTTIVDTVNINGENVIKPGIGKWRWDGLSGQWVKVMGGTSGTDSIGTTGTMSGTKENVLNIGGTDAASEWRWNNVTGSMGSNTGTVGGNTGSKRTIQVRQKTQQPTRAEIIVDGRIVGGAFGGAVSGRSSGSGSAGIMDMNAFNREGQGSQRSMSASGNSNLFPLLPLIGDSADRLVGGKRKRRSDNRSTPNSRAKRATNKQNYQALVTNCQGQNGQGPSIMVVANQGDVQFALKTYNNDLAVLSVPAVEGWNDVTLIYDGRSLTGVVENSKGLQKASVSLQGNVERRQAGLLVGSCQGFASFRGEIDDLSIYNCLTPAIEELRDRIVLQN